jgi:hypothetical protein
LLRRFQALGPRRLAASATAFGVIALATALTVTSASASEINETATLQNWSTIRCLDSNYGGGVYTVPPSSAGNRCNGGDPYQTWNLWDNGSLGLGIQDAGTGLCLDSNYAKNVYTDGCNADDSYQEWNAGGEGPGITFQDVQTGFCLDSNAAGNVYTFACNWNDWYQNWVW